MCGGSENVNVCHLMDGWKGVCWEYCLVKKKSLVKKSLVGKKCLTVVARLTWPAWEGFSTTLPTGTNAHAPHRLLLLLFLLDQSTKASQPAHSALPAFKTSLTRQHSNLRQATNKKRKGRWERKWQFWPPRLSPWLGLALSHGWSVFPLTCVSSTPSSLSPW